MFNPNIAKVAKLGFLFTLATIAAITILAVQKQTAINVTWPQSKSEIARFMTTEVDDQNNINVSEYKNGRWRHLSEQQMENFSKLGRILYLDEPYPMEINKSYTILLWKYGMTIHDRHMKRYSNKEFDPFELCSVKNCKVTYEDSALDTADLVIFHLHRMKGLKDIPNTKNRTANQIWAWSTDESPYHTFLGGGKLADYNGLFNWSMHYRMDADIPVAYGRTVLKTNIDNNYKFDFYKWLLSKKHDVLIAIMGSNCGSKNHRWEYVAELKKYISVDMYGGCGTIKCGGHFNKNCPAIDKYMFYLSFENSNCDEYITEKVWWNAYEKNSIPIIMGGKKDDYRQQLPPDSYINVDDFATPRDLAAYLQYLTNTPGELERYFKWKKHFEVLNEHGYFQTASWHYCRACEALNVNDRKTKVFNNLTSLWSTSGNCYPAWDKPQE